MNEYLINHICKDCTKYIPCIEYAIAGKIGIEYCKALDVLNKLEKIKVLRFG